LATDVVHCKALQTLSLLQALLSTLATASTFHLEATEDVELKLVFILPTNIPFSKARKYPPTQLGLKTHFSHRMYSLRLAGTRLASSARGQFAAVRTMTTRTDASSTPVDPLFLGFVSCLAHGEIQGTRSIGSFISFGVV
jgi:hypothetical protein